VADGDSFLTLGRTSKVTPHRGTGRDLNPSGVSVVLALAEGLQDETYTMGSSLLGPCDLIQDGRHVGFCPKLEIIKKQPKLKNSEASDLISRNHSN